MLYRSPVLLLMTILVAMPLFSGVAAEDNKNKCRLENPMIRTGASPRLKSGGFAYFTVTGENPTPAGEVLSYRLRPQATAANIYSGAVFLPAETKIDLKRPVFLESAESFLMEAFHKGRRIRQEGDNKAEGKLLGFREGMVGFWNDSLDLSSITGWKDFSFHGKTYFPFTFSSKYFLSAQLLSSLQSLVILRPDFSLYSENQLEEILQFAADGGCVIFADPEGTQAAQKTVLRTLLPIHILSCRKRLNDFLSSFPGLAGAAPRSREVDFLYFLPPEGKKGLVTGEKDSYPLLWEAPYGKGIVKVFAFLPEAENFPGAERKASPIFLSHVLHGPERETFFHSYKEVLDLLTGFSVPGTALIKWLLVIYFLLLILLAVFARIKKRLIIFWGGSAILAIAGTLFVLQQAKNRISRKEQLLAVLAVTPANDHASGRSANSLFSVREFSGDVAGKGEELLIGFPTPAFRNFYGGNSSNSLLAMTSPVDARKKSNGLNTLASFHIPARSSRQYLILNSRSSSLRKFRPPRPYTLYLGKNGLSFSERTPLLLPAELKEKAEHAFLILPGGIASLELSEGRLTKDFSSTGGALLKDALTTAVEESLWKNHHTSTGSPLLALVMPYEEQKKKEKSSLLSQGKEVCLYPVTWQIRPGKILLQPELFSLKANMQSRMYMEGGMFRKNLELMPDTEIDLSFELPSCLRNIRLEELRVVLNLTGSRMVKVTPYLYEGKNGIPGILQEDGSFLFKVKGKALLHPVSNRGRLILKSALDREGQILAGSGMRSFNWGVLSLSLSGKGELSTSSNPIIY